MNRTLALALVLAASMTAAPSLAGSWTQDDKMGSRFVDASSVSLVPNQSPALMAFRFSPNSNGDPVYWSAVDCKTGQLYIPDNEGGWKLQTYADGKPAMADLSDTLICH